MAQFEALKAPLGRLHFAGEAYSFDYGFLQSSINTGRDTANKVTSCINVTPGSSRYRSCTSFTPSYLARGCTYDAAENYDEMAQEDNGSCQFDDIASTAPKGKKTKRSRLLQVGLISNVSEYSRRRTRTRLFLSECRRSLVHHSLLKLCWWLHNLLLVTWPP